MKTKKNKGEEIFGKDFIDFLKEQIKENEIVSLKENE